MTTKERHATLRRMVADHSGSCLPEKVERTVEEMDELVASGHLVRLEGSGCYQVTESGQREAWLDDETMTTAKHVAAIEEAIRAAGGPDRIRFCPVSIELVAQARISRPVTIEVVEREDGLVDLHLTEQEAT